MQNSVPYLALFAWACASEPLTLESKSGTTGSSTPPDSAAPSLDSDGDGFAEDVDCDDTDPAISPAATEVCNGWDDNCNGTIDEGFEVVAWFIDTDGDGFGSLDEVQERCAAPEGFVGNDWDCNDDDDAMYPGAAEFCSGPDLNCDGLPPEPCRTCLDLQASGVADGDGVYTIQPDSLGETPVWCDMTTDGGGWTLLQRTVWDWAESAALLTSYTEWYGTTVGSPEPTRAFRIAGRGWPELAKNQEHLLVLVPRDAETGNSCGTMAYKGTEGRVLVSSYAAYITGMQADVPIINADTLSTGDQGPSQTCVSTHAVPWFYASCCSTCPTYQSSYWSDSPHPMADYPTTVPDLTGQLAADVCGESGPQRSNTGGFVGVMEMAYFVR